jgi:hypothetical protein
VYLQGLCIRCITVKTCLAQVDVSPQPESADVCLLRSRTGRKAGEEKGMIIASASMDRPDNQELWNSYQECRARGGSFGKRLAACSSSGAPGA